jgi:hypothetical protein
MMDGTLGELPQPAWVREPARRAVRPYARVTAHVS